MSNGLSDGVIENVLNHIFATGTYAKPTGLKLHLFKADPHAAGAEVSDTVDDTAYVEQTITFAVEGATDDKRVYSDDFVGFPPVVYGSGAGSYEVSHWAVIDGSANLLAAGAFPTPITRLAGEPLAFSPGAIYIELSRTA
tara:strand:+ start:42198 stop:42617 length:420 start_codon:yes stop_codon:yes gene_type:complete